METILKKLGYTPLDSNIYRISGCRIWFQDRPDLGRILVEADIGRGEDSVLFDEIEAKEPNKHNRATLVQKIIKLRDKQVGIELVKIAKKNGWIADLHKSATGSEWNSEASSTEIMVATNAVARAVANEAGRVRVRQLVVAHTDGLPRWIFDIPNFL